MIGYKVFKPNWTCRGFQYAVGKTYEEDVKPSCCKKGFHFCTELKDCFNYYSFDPNNKIAEIEALGEIDAEVDGSKHCTNKIKIIRELSWEEVLRIVNTGTGNSGYCNSGNYNCGNCNSGNSNSGNHNSGNYNCGDWNSENHNSGDYNCGNWNSGNWNSGYCNSGHWNSGNWNSGNHNGGYCNSGHWNSGDYNNGDFNCGDWNNTNFSNGCFNTEESKIFMFNKPSGWTIEDWYHSEAKELLNTISHNALQWVYSDKMSEEEKEQHPKYKTTGGYLKKRNKSECNQLWWNSLSDHKKNIIKSLPNFDAEIFKEITGIDVYYNGQ